MTYGFQSAAWYYFGRDVQYLTKAEQLVLVTIAKNATMYNPFTRPEAFRNRFLVLSDYLYEWGLFTKEEHLQVNQENLSFLAQTNSQFDYIIDFLKRYYLDDHLKLKTTSLLVPFMKEVGSVAIEGLDDTQ